MPTPIDQAKAYCAELVKIGVRATWDPRKVVAPCVLIAPPTVEFTLNCGGDAQWEAYAIAAVNVGHADAWTQLDGLVAKALHVLPVERAEPDEFSPDNTSPLPAYLMTWAESVDWSG